MLYLSKHTDSNTVARVNELILAEQVQRNATDVAINVRILNDLHSGKTNDALRLLETKLNGALVVFGTPVALKHDPQYDNILKQAKEYRSKYPYNSGSPEVDAAIARAFESIQK